MVLPGRPIYILSTYNYLTSLILHICDFHSSPTPIHRTPNELPVLPRAAPPSHSFVQEPEPEPANPAPPEPDDASLFGSPLRHSPPGLAPIGFDDFPLPSPTLTQFSGFDQAPINHHHQEAPPQESQNLTEVSYLPGEDPSLFERPTGCSEQPHIRIAYLTAASSHVLDRLRRDRVELNLAGSMAAYETLGALPARPKPVTSLSSVLQRLGLDVEPYLTQRPMCSVCYCIYSFDSIASARSPICRQPGCQGHIWEYSAEDPSARKPKRVAAYGNLVSWLRRMFMRPDFVASLRSATRAHEVHSARNHSVLYDVCDGEAWDLNSFGLERTLELDGTVSDILIRPDRRLSLGFGLFANLNLDWFRVTDKYSVGGIYLSILNLHRSVRNLPWNVMLACTIPGPGEPSLEDLNHVLEPIVEEFKRLYAGMNV